MRTSRARRAWLGLAGLALAAAIGGCASSEPSVPPGVLDVSGVWEGIWNGGSIGRGRITLVLKQVGTKVTGTLAMSGAPAISATDGPLEGVVSDTTFSFGQPQGAMEGEMDIKGEDMRGDTRGRLKATIHVHRQPSK